MDTWLVCARASEAQKLATQLKRVRPMADVHVAANPFALRAELAAAHQSCSVLVGDPCEGVEAVNLAAAVAEDGGASHVMLAVAAPSGSLRSRASKAGLDGVVDADGGLGELAAPRRSAQPNLSETVPQVVGPEVAVHRQARPATTQVASQTSAPVVCFASGRGGVGKTSLMALSATLAASWGMSVACLDLDLAFGNLFSLFGLDGPADLSELGLYAPAREASLQHEAVVSAGKQAAEGVALWGPCDLPEHAELVEPVVGDLIRQLSLGHDLVLIDTSPAWSDSCALAVQVADRLVLVSDDEAGGAGSLTRAAALAVRLGVTRSRIVRVSNRAERRRDEEDYLMRARVGLETASFYRLPPEPELPELAGLGRVGDLALGGGDLAGATGKFLAKTLEELGVLPHVPEALQALDWQERRGRAWPFGKEVR